ncbi:MAG: hypothetical protein PHW10_04965 [Candidatus Peribacteraceae bacterium]|nr:hypothetical protein [Candidatus Peribacteraceae bacterium]
MGDYKTPAQAIVIAVIPVLAVMSLALLLVSAKADGKAGQSPLAAQTEVQTGI